MQMHIYVRKCWKYIIMLNSIHTNSVCIFRQLFRLEDESQAPFGASLVKFDIFTDTVGKTLNEQLHSFSMYVVFIQTVLIRDNKLDNPLQF